MLGNVHGGWEERVRGNRSMQVGVGTIVLLNLPWVSSSVAWAQSFTATASPSINAADTAWVLVCSALVLAMTVPGLALFYGGLVRSKNVLGTVMQSFAILCLVSLLWMVIGYSVAFGPDVKGLVGNLECIGLMGVGLAPHTTYAPTIPHQA